MRVRWLASISAVAVGLTLMSASASASTVSLNRGGGSPSLGVDRAALAKPALSADPTTIYPPNELCLKHDYVFPTSTTVTGTGLPATTAFSVEYHDRKATIATGVTTSKGALTATVHDVSQPDGNYKMVAKAGTKTATTPVYSSGDTCAIAHGKSAALHWSWQAVGFDAKTTANLLISGSFYESKVTNASGAFTFYFVKACPSTGTLDLSFQGYIGGELYTFGSGSLDCS
jgi:hypothetical protein